MKKSNKNRNKAKHSNRVTIENKTYPEQRGILKELLTVVEERTLFYFDEKIEMACNGLDDYIQLALNNTVEDHQLYFQPEDERLKPFTSLIIVEETKLKNNKSILLNI